MSSAQRSLGRRAVRGALVTLTGQVGRILIQVLSVVVLARLLSPSDYGLLAMVLAIVGVAEIFRDFGLSSAAIQSRTLSEQQRSNLFWINTGIGVVLALVVVLCAPLLAALYDQPQLVEIARALAGVFVLNGASTQFRAHLNREMLFRRLAITDTVAPALALALAASLASSGAGYWALVTQQLSQAAILLVLVSISAHWRPRRPRRGADMGRLLRFGSNLVGTQLIGYAANNIDSVLIGSRFGAGSLGLYNRAFQLLMTPLTQVRAPTTTVALPVLSTLQDDPPRFERFVQQGQVALGYTLVPVLAVVVGAAEPIAGLMLGDRWTEVTPLLRLLACAGAFQTLAYVGYWVYLSKGLTRDLLHYTLITAVIKVVCVATGSWFGLVGVATGYALAPLVGWPLSLWWLSRRAGLTRRPLYGGAARIIVLGAVVAAGAAGGAALGDSAAWAGTLLGSGGGLVAGALLVLCLPPFRRDANELVGTVRTALAVRSDRT